VLKNRVDGADACYTLAIKSTKVAMAPLDHTRSSVREPVSARGERAHALALALERYYGSVTTLSAALDTTRDTVRTWLNSPPSKPREDILLRAERLWLLGRAARRYMVGVRNIGAWTLAPHLGLNGESPARLLVAEGDNGLERLLDDMATYAPSRPDLPLDANDELIWQGVQEMLGPEALAQAEKVFDAPQLDVTDDDLAGFDAFD
jgi:hypothetical protein